MGYSPWDSGIPYSSVNTGGGPTVMALWGLIVATKDQDGVTDLTPQAVVGLWSQSREPRALNEVQLAWDYLAAPDPNSKNAALEGRRIIPTGDGRWKVVSHEHYREKHSGLMYRSQAADRQRRKRERDKQRERDMSRDGVTGRDPLDPVTDPAPVVRKDSTDDARARAETGGDPCSSTPANSAGQDLATAQLPGRSTLPTSQPPAPAAVAAPTDRPRVRVPYQPSAWFPTREARARGESSVMAMASEIAQIRHARGVNGTESDPARVLLAASSYTDREGHERTMLDVARMSPDRLKRTQMQLEEALAEERAKRDAPAAKPNLTFWMGDQDR